jgi:hypothetical protein
MEVILPAIKSNEDKEELYSDEYPFHLPLRINAFDDQKEYIKFVKNCEKLIRGSQEYADWRNYIFDVLCLDSCSFSQESRENVTIEIHHAIPSLYVVVKGIINKKLAEEQSFCTFDICLEAIGLHYKNCIGYCPLATTIHEKVTNNSLNIPIEFIKGNYQSFIDSYKKYLDQDDIDLINQKLACNIKNSQGIAWKTGSYPGVPELEIAA